MDVVAVFDELDVTGSVFVIPIGSDGGVGVAEHELVTPASVMKLQASAGR